MSKPQLDDLKKQFQEQKEKQANNNRTESDYYPFWQIADDETSVVRVLPIANSKSAMPFLEKDHHKISIEGKDEVIPCIEMYGEKCPICELSRKYYKIKDEDSQKKGKYYYRNRSYLASAYIKKDPLPLDSETKENYEGKVKVIQFGNQLYKKFNASLETLVKNDEIDDVPWSLENGLDFNIVKKNGGQFAKWDLASDFSRRTSSLPAAFVEEFNPVDLSKYLPANPGLDKVQRMLEAHMNDTAYDDGDSASSVAQTSSVEKHEVKEEAKVERKEETKTETPKDEHKPVVVKEAAEPASDEDDDIQAMLRKLKNRVVSD